MGLSSKQVSGDHIELNWTQNMLASNTIHSSTTNPRSTTMKRQLQSQQSDPLKCPRCDSTNTKFCYYNNYNKTQPRHFCKACKRHWTKGGTLRNVPVGGGRKNKRVKRNNAGAGAGNTVHHSVLPLGFSNQKEMFPDDHKGLFFKPVENERRSVLESYPDIDQVSWDFNGGFIGNPNLQQNLGFSILSSFSSIDTNTNPNPIIPTSFSPLLTGYKEDSTITTTRMIMPPSSSSAINVSQPWLQVPSTSNFLEPNYWNWNDIDSMVLADLNKPFEDPQLKP